jgi:hypothetical protein
VASFYHLELWVSLSLRRWVHSCPNQVPELLEVIRHYEQLKVVLQKGGCKTHVEVFHSLHDPKSSVLIALFNSMTRVANWFQNSKGFASAMLAANFPANCVDLTFLCMFCHILLSQEIPYEEWIFNLNHLIVTIIFCQIVEGRSFFDSQIWHGLVEAQVVDGHRS